MFRLTLRKKLLLFTIVIPIVPLLVAGRTMIRIAEDELKSSVNEQLVTTAEELAHEIDTLFERTWLAPFLSSAKPSTTKAWASRKKLRF
ncbi:MAG: hypothetical protein ACXW2G_07265 [Burkholderiaceae bacterium]